MLAPSIIIDHLDYYYGKRLLFNHLNFVFQGEKCHCILGMSGVGKTTLLRLIAGLENPLFHEKSSVRVYPEVKERSVIQLLSWLGQKGTLLPWLNVLENVLLGYRLRGKVNPFHKKQAQLFLTKVGLADWSKAMPDQLSGGMQQRVMLARTMIEDRPIVLMDEPFSALDAIHRYEMQELASETLKNKTMIMVTHDPMEALRMAHYIHILDGFPAQFTKTIQPAGEPPRDVSDPEVVIHFAQLLQLLRASKENLIC